MLFLKRCMCFILTVVMVSTALVVPCKVDAISNGEPFSDMLARAEALVNYEWIPQQRIYTWNANPYNGKTYFEAGETVKGVPYTLFSWELGFDGLLSLEQYKAKCSVNYSTSAYCNSVQANRIGPAYGNCCATLVSEVFGGKFMNGQDPRYDGVGTIEDSPYSLVYTKVKSSAIQPGDAISCTSGAHIVWVGNVTSTSITIYESTPPVSQKVVLNLASHTDSNGYLIYGGNTYNIVIKSGEIIRDDLSSVADLDMAIPMPIQLYSNNSQETVVYSAINGAAKNKTIPSSTLCFVDAVFKNGWCHVNYKLSTGGLDHGYVKTTDLFKNTPQAYTSQASIPVWTHSDLSTAFGRTAIGYTDYIVGETSNAYQIIYELANGGFKCGWISKNDFNSPPEMGFMNQFTPIKGYPCTSGKFNVTESDYSTVCGQIFTTDYCTITQVFSDGYCYVTYPLDAGGEKSAYTHISNFVYNTAIDSYSVVTGKQIDVYTNKELSTYQNWWTSADDPIYILGECGNALQICYPIDSVYGGGFKLGWIKKSDIEVEPNPPTPIEKTLIGISIFSFPYKTQYTVGDTLVVDGLQVLLSYSDSSTEVLTEGFTIGDYDFSSDGTKTINVCYDGLTTSFDVNVIKPVVEILPYYEITSASGTIGSTVEVLISINDNPGIISLRSVIDYDDEYLTLVSVENSNLLNGYTPLSSSLSSPFTIRWADSSATENNNNDGEIIKLVFAVKSKPVDGKTTVSITHVEARDIYGVKIDFIAALTTVLIDDENRVGDVDNDGSITDWDAITLARYLVGQVSNIDQYSADIDNDGSITDWDSIIFERYLAGWDISL